MTTKELSKLYYLNREIESDKERLEELKSAATNINSKITGLPHVSGISNKTALAAEIADAENVIQEKYEQCIAEYNRINHYVVGIENSIIRQIIQLRFINMCSWEKIAMKIGGGNTGDGIRMQLKRFLSTKK